MPYKLEWVEPDHFMSYKGVDIYHDYDNNELGITLDYHYRLSDTIQYEQNEGSFNITHLDAWESEEGCVDFYEHIKKILKKAIDSGELTAWKE